MDENGGIKLRGIRQIVRLKASLQQWQAVSKAKAKEKEKAKEREKEKEMRRLQMMMMMNSSNSSSSSSNSSNMLSAGAVINKRLTNIGMGCCDSDEESICQSPEHLADVPKGYLAVYVGRELRRFIIPTAYLSHSVFKVLLEKAEEEFGFDHTGGLTFPCEIETFKYLLNCMETGQVLPASPPPPPPPPPAGGASLISREG